MHVPGAIAEGDEASARLHQPSRQQHPLACAVATILITNGIRLRPEIESLAGINGTEQVVSPLIKAVHGIEVVGLFLHGEVGVDGIKQTPPSRKSRFADPGGKFEVAHDE